MIAPPSSKGRHNIGELDEINLHDQTIYEDKNFKTEKLIKQVEKMMATNPSLSERKAIEQIISEAVEKSVTQKNCEQDRAYQLP